MKRGTVISVVVSVLLAGCAGYGDTPADSGVQGTVLVGPQCPVVQENSPCPDAPLATEIQVLDRSGEVVATVRSGEDGRFRIELAPGAYVLQGLAPGSGGLPYAAPVDVTVTAHQFTQADVLFDSGIR